MRTYCKSKYTSTNSITKQVPEFVEFVAFVGHLVVIPASLDYLDYFADSYLAGVVRCLAVSFVVVASLAAFEADFDSFAASFEYAKKTMTFFFFISIKLFWLCLLFVLYFQYENQFGYFLPTHNQIKRFYQRLLKKETSRKLDNIYLLRWHMKLLSVLLIWCWAIVSHHLWAKGM